MPDYTVARFSALRDGEGRVVRPAGLEVALFRNGDRVFALGNACRHTGAALGEGFVIDGCAVCPSHGWRYRLDDGRRVPELDDLAVPAYPVRVDGDDVVVTISDDAMRS